MHGSIPSYSMLYLTICIMVMDDDTRLVDHEYDVTILWKMTDGIESHWRFLEMEASREVQVWCMFGIQEVGR